METANSVLCIIAARTRIRDSQWPPPAQPVRLRGQKHKLYIYKYSKCKQKEFY
jgi:hypothetical protein